MIQKLTEKSWLYTSAFNKSRSAFPAVAAGLRGKLEGGGGSPAPSTVNFARSVFTVVALEVGTGDDAVEPNNFIFLMGGNFFFNTGSLFSTMAVTSGPTGGEGGFESTTVSESDGRERFVPMATGIPSLSTSMSSKSALDFPFRVRVFDGTVIRVCGGEEGGSSSTDMSDRQRIESSSSSSSSEITVRRDFLLVFALPTFAEGSPRRS